MGVIEDLFCGKQCLARLGGCVAALGEECVIARVIHDPGLICPGCALVMMM